MNITLCGRCCSFFLSNLEYSVPSLLELITTFGEFSGYKINMHKSSILYLNEQERQQPRIQSPFSAHREGFTYLGIQITPEMNDLVPANYNPVGDSVVVSLNRWTLMPISLIGRVNIFKMNTLPTFLYLFQSINPLPPPESFFQKCKKIFTNFIWNNRRSRLRFTLLYLPYHRGGLQLPNLRWYYWAAQLRAAMCYFSPEEAPAWVKIEACSAQGLPLSSYFILLSQRS